MIIIPCQRNKMWHCCLELNFLFLFIFFLWVGLWFKLALNHFCCQSCKLQAFFTQFFLRISCPHATILLLFMYYLLAYPCYGWVMVYFHFYLIHPFHFLSMQPRRSRGASPFILSAYSCIVFRPDAIFVLLRKAYKDPDLGSVCRMVCSLCFQFGGKELSLSLSKWCSSPCI